MYRQLKHLRFAIAVIVILILAAMLLHYGNQWLTQSEYVKIRLQLQNLESALRWRMASAIIDSDFETLARLPTQNPFTLLDVPERQNYFGLVSDGQWQNFPKGKWGYDPARNEVVYRLKHPELVRKPFAPSDQLRWRVKIIWIEDRLTPKQAVKRASDIHLVPATQFNWWYEK